MKKKFRLLVLSILLATFGNAQTTASLKEINITNLIAYEKNSRLYIEWSAIGGSNTNHWEIQSSVDGKKFSTIALVLGPDPSTTGEQYRYKEEWMTKKASAWYRIVRVNTLGERQQSEMTRPVKQSFSQQASVKKELQVLQ